MNLTTEHRAQLARNCEAQEGRIRHMYLDSARPAWVTVGVGHRLATVGDALALPFMPAIRIASDFARVAAAQPGLIASAYEPLCETRLSDEAIDAMLEHDIDTKLAELRRNFREFDEWPASAQAAVADMAFNLGTSGLLSKFPRLGRAIAERKWGVCAAECERKGISVERNCWTFEMFREAGA